mgnify:CR=1 FL=1
MIGLVGKKVGMTRIFTEDGVSIPVTVIEVEANRVTQVKDLANDGYRAIQVTTGAKKANRVTKPEAGHKPPLPFLFRRNSGVRPATNGRSRIP